MSGSAPSAERLAALEAEITRLRKVSEALMNRVERSTDAAGSSFSLFEFNLLLQNEIDQHMRQIKETNFTLQCEIRERKQAEEALRKERDFTAAVLDTAGALVVVLDTEGKIVRFNRTCEQITGFAFPEVRDRHVWDIFLLREEVDRVKAAFASLKAGQFPSQVENYWLTKDGGRRLIAWSNTAIVDGEGSVEHIIGTGIDITQATADREAVGTRLRYEEGLAGCSQTLLKEADPHRVIPDALAHLRRAADVGRAYIFENFQDPDDGLCCRQVYEVCGPGVASEADKMLLQHLRYTETLAPWRELLERNQPLGGPVREMSPELQKYVHGGGVLSLLVLPVWVSQEWYGFIGFDDVQEERAWNDEEVRLLRTAADMIGGYLSKRKALEALRLSEERFRSLVENANDVIYSMNPKGEFTYLSPKFADYTGYAVEECLGKPLEAFLYEEDIPTARKWFREGITESERRSGSEWRVRDRGGNLRWFISDFSVIRDGENHPQEIIGVAHDITRMKKLLEELEQANRHLRDTQTQLVQSEKMASLGKLVAGIAHEINTPIGSVGSMHDTLMKVTQRLVELLRSECREGSPQYKKMESLIKMIEDANRVIKMGTDRVTTIVRRLRSFARLDEAELVAADIHEGLEDTLTLIYHEIKHNITVHRNYGKIPILHCYMARLNQVFVNLLINAKQAIRNKGEITITTYHLDNRVCIEIADTGAGIPEEDLDKVFDPGFTTKGVGVGTGLGLSIVYQIIRAHHGEIKVDSQVGKGTKFTIAIPTNLKEMLMGSRSDRGSSDHGVSPRYPAESI